MNGSDDVTRAITWFWGSRASQSDSIGHSQGGAGRDAVVGGQHLNAVRDLIVSELLRLGVPKSSVHITGRTKTMPGFLRPTKNWDLALTDSQGAVVALFELKSQVGSFGNNANNRAEESIGNPADLRFAVEQGLIPVKPWTAYVYVIWDVEQSRRKSNNRSNSYYPIDPIFHNISYIDRVAILAERLVALGLYDAAWVIATKKPLTEGDDATWLDPSNSVGWRAFFESLRGLVSLHFNELK